MVGTVLQSGLVRGALVEFLDRMVDAIPTVVTGVVFLLLAVVFVKVVLVVLRAALTRALRGESPLYHQFVVTVVAIFLWFGVGLAFLSVVGLDEIAASLGTAAGFLALGVSYATSDMIEDAVAGVYLLRDPDFSPGDAVRVGDMEGTVRSIELRKTRFEVEGNTVVRGNADIEKRWMRLDA